MPTAADLIAHPRTFMRSSILMVLGGAGNDVGGQRNFTFRRAVGTVGVNMLACNAPMEVYSLSLEGDAGDPVSAWWCPFMGNDWLGTTLPGQGGPNMMFTYAMDGCTFAAGSVNAQQDVLVHHVNCANAASSAGSMSTEQQRTEQQRKLQRNIARSLVTNAALVDPDDYYDPANAAVPIPQGAKISTVTFGRRSSQDGWKFYTHQWYTVPGDRTTLRFIGTQRVI